MWSLDANLRLTLLATLVCSELVEHIAFRRARSTPQSDKASETTGKPKMSKSELENSSDENHWFFFLGGDKGTIYLADDMGHLKKFIETGTASLATLLYVEHKSHIIFLTKSSFLHTYSISENLTAKRVQNVKISTSSAASGIKGQSKLKAIYIGNGILATCSNEQFIRIWNLDGDENFVLNDPHKQIIRPIEDIAFNPRKRAIAGITSDKRIIIWQYVGESLAPEGRQALQSSGPHDNDNDKDTIDDTDDDNTSDGSKKATETQIRNTGSIQDWEYYAEWSIDKVRDTNDPATATEGLVRVEWGPNENIISAYSSNDFIVTILQETVLQRVMRHGVAIVQISTDSLRIEKQAIASNFDNFDGQVDQKSSRLQQPITIRCGIRIKNISATRDHIAISSGNKIEIWEMREGIVRSKSSLDIPSRCIALHNEGIFVAPLSGSRSIQTGDRNRDDISEKGSVNRVEVYSYTGTRKQTIEFSEEEGPVVDIDILGDYIAIGTQNNFVQLWHIAGREAKQASSSRRIFTEERKQFQKQMQYRDTDKSVRQRDMAQSSRNIRQISSIRVNSNGTKISVLSRFVKAKSVVEPDTSLLVYDLEQDKEDIYDFRHASRFPLSHYWDESESKLFGVIAKKFTESWSPRRKQAGIRETSSQATTMIERDSKFSVCTLFATPDHGVLLQDSFPLDQKAYIGLIGISVPFLYFVKRENSLSFQKKDKNTIIDQEHYVERQYMRDFHGIEDESQDNKMYASNLTRATRDALLNFSYFLTIGNMEDAYKSVKMIKDSSVWHNMARMCIKTKNLEVAEICLGNMQDARASMALRETKDIPELEARIAMLAIQLGLLDEAERLYTSCKRYDLLNKMHQSMGKWDKALEVAKTHDRIHLRTTHYLYARHLESIGDIKGAIKHYEKSKTHAFEVPRMIYENEQVRSK